MRRTLPLSGVYRLLEPGPVVLLTTAALRRTRECVIAIPTVELAPKVVRCGNVSGRLVDTFVTIGLTAVAACSWWRTGRSGCRQG
jgi:hypothetical protein